MAGRYRGRGALKEGAAFNGIGDVIDAQHTKALAAFGVSGQSGASGRGGHSAGIHAARLWRRSWSRGGAVGGKVKGLRRDLDDLISDGVRLAGMI